MDHDANHKIIVMLVATNWSKQKQICVKVVASMASKSFDLASNWLQARFTNTISGRLPQTMTFKLFIDQSTNEMLSNK